MTVEVGTNVYLTVADADAYAAANFLGADTTAWDAADEPTKEAGLRQAAQYIDARFRDRFPGLIQSTSQDLEWPRINACDRSGRVISGIPDAVKNASVELAKERIKNGVSLAPALPRGGKIKRTKVDVIETEYMDGAPSETVYQFALDLLSGVLMSVGRRVKRV